MESLVVPLPLPFTAILAEAILFGSPTTLPFKLVFPFSCAARAKGNNIINTNNFFILVNLVLFKISCSLYCRWSSIYSV